MRGHLRVLALAGQDLEAYVCLVCLHTISRHTLPGDAWLLDDCFYTPDGHRMVVHRLLPPGHPMAHRLALCPDCARRFAPRSCVLCMAHVPDTLHRQWWDAIRFQAEAGEGPQAGPVARLALPTRWLFLHRLGFRRWETLCPYCLYRIGSDFQRLVETWAQSGVYAE